MSYFGRAFEFDSVPCETYDLMLYDLGGQGDDDIALSASGDINDEAVGDQWKPYFYGVRPAGRLEFDITFGVNERRLDNGKFLDRFEVAAIASWLCGHKEYKWLYIDQVDMFPFGYKCIITDLQVTSYGKVPWALRAHISCDSPYAYLPAETTRISLSGSKTYRLTNVSSLNDFYMPVIKYTRSGGSTFSVINAADNRRGPSITNIPGSVGIITIDNAHGVITNNQDINLYDRFNFQFLRLARGVNELTITGTGILEITCQFPINVGG